MIALSYILSFKSPACCAVHPRNSTGHPACCPHYMSGCFPPCVQPLLTLHLKSKATTSTLAASNSPLFPSLPHPHLFLGLMKDRENFLISRGLTDPNQSFAEFMHNLQREHMCSHFTHRFPLSFPPPLKKILQISTSLVGVPS